MTPDSFERRLRIALLLVLAGLAVEAGGWRIVHPLAFVAFLTVACPLVLAGVFVFLWALVRDDQR